MQRATTYYDYIHETLSAYMNMSDLLLVVMAVVGWAASWVIRRLAARVAAHLALQRASAEKQQAYAKGAPETPTSSRKQAAVSAEPAFAAAAGGGRAKRKARKAKAAPAEQEAVKAEQEDASSSAITSRLPSSCSTKEPASSAASSCDGAQHDERAAAKDEAEDEARGADGDSTEADEEEIASLFEQVAARAMTPVCKEVVKLEKRVRKLDSLKERLDRGESLSKLQLAALARAEDLRAQMEAALHEQKVDEVTASMPGSHYYVWDAPETEAMYYCPAAGAPEEVAVGLYAVPAWVEQERAEGQPQWSPSSWPWGYSDGWSTDQGHWSGGWDLCWSFRNQRFCRKGANCTWRHEGDLPRAGQAEPEEPLSPEERERLRVMVERLASEQLETVFEFLAPELGDEEEKEEEVSLDPDMLTPSRQRALFKLVERASATRAAPPGSERAQ
mmetsp:Transcript_99115/g.256226  ORF Transcript_99115/g.256226 Transcript_99115/m.256226 type:complete len:446 (+) Transcript_99115:59-1396(+)